MYNLIRPVVTQVLPPRSKLPGYARDMPPIFGLTVSKKQGLSSAGIGVAYRTEVGVGACGAVARSEVVRGVVDGMMMEPVMIISQGKHCPFERLLSGVKAYSSGKKTDIPGKSTLVRAV